MAYKSMHNTLFALVVMALIFMACSHKTYDSPSKQVLGLLSGCPSWESNDNFSYDRIIAIMKQVAKHDTDTIRKALTDYIALAKESCVNWEGVVFILNRFLFNIPEWRSVDDQHFGCWRGVPWESELVRELWPLNIGPDGELYIVDSFHGYMGPTYRGLEEFDYFSFTFGRRGAQRN